MTRWSGTRTGVGTLVWLPSKTSTGPNPQFSCRRFGRTSSAMDITHRQAGLPDAMSFGSRSVRAHGRALAVDTPVVDGRDRHPEVLGKVLDAEQRVEPTEWMRSGLHDQ